ncbi:MAG TPA: polysaccharide biosynthesis/export family protein, partial [Thermodesulfobacteriota bacterium]|nr:polysaccharide biosynthesis/export family protein [Thermodesulfobacteriota bacterium]
AGGPPGRAGTPVPAAAVARDDYVIGPDDVVQITVWRNDTLSRTVPVRPDGKISLPLIHEVQAAGLTPLQLRDEIARRLKEFITNPDVSVSVAEIRSLKINVLGQVHKPGTYDLKRRVSLLEALAMAGGLTPFAAQNRIVVLRQAADGRLLRINVRYRDLVERGDDRQNILLQRGDTVIVPESLF